MALLLPNRKEALIFYNEFTDKMIKLIKEERGTLPQPIVIKPRHGINMAEDVPLTANKTSLFNSSYNRSFFYDGLYHDIGRFPQFHMTGSLSDKDLKKSNIGVEDHGQLGKLMLLEANKFLLKKIIPKTRQYDYVLSEVVGEHTTISNPKYKQDLADIKFPFKDYSLEELLVRENQDILDMLIAAKIAIVQDADRLEIGYNVSNGLWKPAIGSEEKYNIHELAWQKFINFEELDMGYLGSIKQFGCNDGFLLRYAMYLSQVQIRSTLKMLQDRGYIDKMWEETIKTCTNDNNEHAPITDPLMEGAYRYMKLAMTNLIDESNGSKFITPEIRESAKQKTLGEWKHIEPNYIRPFK